MSGPYRVQNIEGGWAVVSAEGNPGPGRYPSAAKAGEAADYLNGPGAQPTPTPGELIRLETGDWVDPAEVVGVGADIHEEGMWVVCVSLRNGKDFDFYCSEDGDEPADMADRIAAQINAARAGKGGER